MNIKNNKGFTLIELLAVTIILLIIFVIAFNAIDAISKKAKIKSVKANALSYFKEIDNYAQISKSDGKDFYIGSFSVDELSEKGFKISGKMPTGGFITFANYRATCGCLEYGKYKINKLADGYSEVIKGSCESTTCSIGIGKDIEQLSIGYTGDSQPILIKKTGTYKLEVWGAQGGTARTSTIIGGYGGYSTGTIDLNEGDIIYVTVGGKGIVDEGKNITIPGGYNGGGASLTGVNGQGLGNCAASAGGATHIAFSSGVLSSLSNNRDSVIMVAGGGSGTFNICRPENWETRGTGSGGGFTGGTGTGRSDRTDTSATGGTQTSGYQFGQGGPGSAGSGGGYYGGNVSGYTGGGGSGYIGYPTLTHNEMYCYNCPESSEPSLKTTSTTCKNEEPTENCAKIGNGFAKITIVDDVDYDD